MNVEVEHRQGKRTRSFLRGEIVYSNGYVRTECTVRDLSSGGARLEAPLSVSLPEFFELIIPQRQITCRARIRWRHKGELGISFNPTREAAAPAADDPASLRQRLQDLEVENRILRAELATMRSALEILTRERH